MKQPNKKGAALVYVILLTALLFILGSGILSLSFQSYDNTVVETKNEQAYLSSKSGLNFFIDSLTNDNVNAIYDKVVTNSETLPASYIDLDGVGNISIKLEEDGNRVKISSESTVNDTNATTFAYLEKTKGFMFDKDKSIYYVNEILNDGNNGKGYLQFENYEKKDTDISSSFDFVKVGTNEKRDDNDFGQISLDTSKLIIDVLEPAIEKHYSKDSTYQLSKENCNSTEKFESRNKQGCTIDKNKDNLTIDLQDTYNGVDALHQYVVYVDSRSENLTITGINLAAEDIIYVVLEEPEDLQYISIIDTDTDGFYEYNGDGTREFKSGNAGEDGYIFDNIEAYEYYNLTSSFPVGIDRFSTNNNYYSYNYYVDGQKSNNFIILADSKGDKTISTIGQKNVSLDAWIYAPNNTVFYSKFQVMHGGIIANKIDLADFNKGGSDGLHGLPLNENFMNIANWDNGLNNIVTSSNESWKVTYE